MPTLLIIDDEPAIQHALRKAFRPPDYNVVVASTSAEGLARLTETTPDAVLLDVHLPDADGLQTFDRVKAVDARVPVILITGKSDATGAVEGFAAGADDVVAKPFHFEVLLARIARRLARARSIDRLRRDNEKLDERVVTRAIEIGELKEQLRESEERLLRLEALRPRD